MYNKSFYILHKSIFYIKESTINGFKNIDFKIDNFHEELKQQIFVTVQ